MSDLKHPFLGFAFGPNPHLRWAPISLSGSILDRDPWLDDGLAPLIPGQAPPPEITEPHYSNRVHGVSIHNGTRCSGIEDAETLALKRLLACAVQPPRHHVAATIDAAGSAIAMQSRRGRGQVLLMHPATLMRLRAETVWGPSFDHAHCAPPRRLHGWQEWNNYEHPLDGGTEFWLKPTMPHDKIVCLWRGQGYETVALLMGQPDRPTLVWNDLGKYRPEDFVRVVEF